MSDQAERPAPHRQSAPAPRIVEAIATDPTLPWQARVRLVSQPRSHLGRGEVRVGMLAMTINPADLLQLSGRYGVKPPLPFIPGHEAACVVLEAGPDAGTWQPGDRALVLASGSCWRDEMVASHRQLVPIDRAIDDLQAAMLAANPATAWVLLRHIRSLQPDDVVLLNAANSAVGQCVRQLAAAWGVRTVNLVRRATAIEPLTDALPGAAWVVDEGQPLDALREQVQQAAAGRPIPLALDAIGGEGSTRLAACASDGAEVVVYGLLSGQAPAIASHDLVFRGVQVRGFWLARWFAEPQNRQLAKGLYAELAALAARGVVRIAVEATYPLERVADALEHAAREGRGGKVLLTGLHRRN